jgi:ribonuclease HI
LDFSSPISLLLSYLEGLHNNVKHIALSVIIHTFHTIWMAHNGIKFISARISLHAAIIKVKTATHTSVTMSKVVVPAGSVAVHMLQDLQLASIYQAPPCIIPVCWKAPSLNWVKVNIDGSLVGAATACGAIFRDANGAFLGVFSCKLDCHSVLHVELIGIIIVIEQAHARGWSKLWIESDSQVVVQASKISTIVPWDLRNRWNNCFVRDMQMVFSHTYREGNICADFLVSLGHASPGLQWWCSLPPALSLAFFSDQCGLPNFRFTGCFSFLFFGFG